MNILITNDDGIRARGLRELVRALHEDAGADIYVCAPDSQRSATGHGITMNRPIEVTEASLEHTVRAWATSGLPADCVKIAMEFLRREGIRIDMVFSGINHGGNLGTDTLYSGTVSAAIEGSLCGVPSAAVSVDSHKAEHFEYACELAVNAAKTGWSRLQAGTADPHLVLNINTPNLPREEIKGLRYTRLGPREYDEIFVPAHMDSEEARLKRDAARAAITEAADKAADAVAVSSSDREQGQIIERFDPAEAGVADPVWLEKELARAAGGREAGAASGDLIRAVRAMEVKLPGAFRYSGTPVQYPDLPEDYDVVANQDGYASITPIQSDLTWHSQIEEIRNWGLG